MKNLKLLRKAKGYSQLQLSEFMHISPSTVAEWEHSGTSVRIGQLIKLCKILDCIPVDLFDVPCCDKNCICIPVFSQNLPCDVTFEQISRDNPYHPLHFGIKLNSDLSHRFRSGDVCFFTFGNTAAQGDVVLSCDENGCEHITHCTEPDSTADIAAVCRFAQMTV